MALKQFLHPALGAFFGFFLAGRQEAFSTWVGGTQAAFFSGVQLQAEVGRTTDFMSSIPKERRVTVKVTAV